MQTERKPKFIQNDSRSMRKAMRKFLIVYISIFVCISLKITTKAEVVADSTDWTILWQGYNCTGTYEGQIKNNKPNGEGRFEGQIFIEEEEGDVIVYEGKWKDGMLHGEGILQNKTSGMMYEGNFTKGKLDGVIKQYSVEENEKVYSLIKYAQDVPYGVMKEYNNEDELINYDCYVYGMSLTQIRNQTEDIEYRDLLYFSNDYMNKVITLKGHIIGLRKADNQENVQYVKVEDENKNVYVLRYSAEYSKIPTRYVPMLGIGDEIELYGYFSGLDNMPEENIEYPCVEMVYADWYGADAFDYKNANLSYDNFKNYPYFYEDESIQLSGIYKGLHKITKKWMYFLVESDSYSAGVSRTYVCRVKNSDKNRKLLPMPETSILMTGDLQVPFKLDNGENVVYCPLVQSTKIFH